MLSINYAQVGDRNVRLRYVPLNPARSGASGYVEYSFSPDAGSLAAGANSGNIQSYFAKADYSAQNELDDYSYATVRDQLVANPRITAYDNGVLIWGQEPASGARVALPETGSELSVRVLGNPVTGDRVVFEVSGTGGVPVQLRLLSQQGHVVSQQPLAGSDRTSERCELSLAGQAAGVYMLEVSTATQRRTAKVIKAD
ncbi:T9SS type A sorting domain-containing protein [Spirosoma sp. KUDC1026]|uniref:T9SS type A sorting domain-containing protein n=1 Tax=Spirosoma sp. KUDC1026 TaxID=2745947 RepID=UPI00159BEA86|nr:T9SS type A sorting domain-containing protein [Spirosoma sp. KUDC1026]QKZ14737.1 T9SS type A sorting domain-containing protein [Spirosoma sp. KUDC1026]